MIAAESNQHTADSHSAHDERGHAGDMLYNAVCYQCQYVGMDASMTRCPLCGFAIILEPGRAPEPNAAPDVSAIFDRVSVSVGAPPLPGVDGRPRKAQILAEARRRRLQSEREGPSRRPTTEGSGTSVSVAEPGRGPSRLLMSVVVLAAGALGLLAACMNATL